MLPYALMWKIPQQNTSTEEWTNSRPKECKALSWSLAGINQYLDFEHYLKYVHQLATCKIVSLQSTPVWRDTCNDVTDAKIVLRGKFKRTLINIHNTDLRHPESNVGLGTRHLDDIPTGERMVICLELFECQGLLLVKKEGEVGVYERLGIYSTSESKCLLQFFYSILEVQANMI
jgi:hypothetical protein